MFCRKFDSCRILKILSNILYAIEYSYGPTEVSTIYLTFSIAYLKYSTSQYASGKYFPLRIPGSPSTGPRERGIAPSTRAPELSQYVLVLKTELTAGSSYT